MLGNDNRVRIAIVSNDRIMPDFLENMLDHRKFVLEAIHPDPESIGKIQKAPPDIFVVDSTDSEGDALTLCRNIRHYCKMPILVLAANHKPELVEQVLDAGADEYLLKPVSGNVLVAYINNLTRRARAEKDAAFSISDGDGKNQQPRLLTY